MHKLPVHWWIAAAIVVVLGTGCGSSGTKTSSGSTSKTSTAPISDAKQANTASARGVTPTAIKIGFSYIDLETLAKAGVIKVDHGPYEPIIRALVDDVNARGGINGRTLELTTAKYSPIGNTEQLAACTKLTEDDQVFAVLNGLLQDNNLCITQQHSTILVNSSGINADRLAKARAPWATSGPSDERSIEALVQLLDANGDLKGHKVAVYAAQAANKPLIDLAVTAIEKAGYKVEDTALVDAADNDTQAATAQDRVFAQRMMDKGIDTVIDVGLFVPAADFDTAGFHPSIYALDQGNVAAAAFTNPLGKFPVVGAVGSDADPDVAYNDTEFKRCRDVWKKASGKDIKTQLQEDLDGVSSGNVAMRIACTDLQIFVAAATAAGSNLTNDSFAKGLESLGQIELAGNPVASFGPDKHDGQDQFQLVKFDSTWKEGQGKLQFVAIGDPITLGRKS